MNYISDCCSAPAVAETLNTWNAYEAGHYRIDDSEIVAVTYGTCSECKEPSQFSEGE